MEILSAFRWSRYFSRREIYALAAVTVYALALRAIAIHSLEFWYDEIVDFYTSRDYSFWQLLAGRYQDPAHPPLYFLLNKSLQIISGNERFIRSFSLLATAGTLYLMPILFAKLFRAREAAFNVAWFALLFVAHSPVLTALGIIAQSYSLTFLFALVSAILFADLLDTKSFSPARCIGLAVVNFLLVFADYAGVWLLVACGGFWLCGLVTRRWSAPQNKNMALAQTTSLILLSCWAIPFAMKFGTAMDAMSYLQDRAGYATEDRWLGPFKYWGYQFLDFEPELFEKMGIDGVDSSILFLGASMTGLFLLAFLGSRGGAFFLALAIFPVLVSHAVSLSYRAILHPRNMFLVTFALVVGYSGLASWSFHRRFLKPLAWGLSLVWAVLYFHSFPSLPYRPAEIIGGEDVARFLLEKAPGSRWLMVSTHRPYRLANFKFFAERLGATATFGDEGLVEEPVPPGTTLFFLNISPVENADNIYRDLAKKIGCRLEVFTEKPPRLSYAAKCGA